MKRIHKQIFQTLIEDRIEDLEMTHQEINEKNYKSKVGKRFQNIIDAEMNILLPILYEIKHENNLQDSPDYIGGIYETI